MNILSAATQGIISHFRSQAGNLRARMDATGAELEKARRRRDELKTLPLPPEELAEFVFAHFAAKSDAHVDRCKESLRWLVQTGPESINCTEMNIVFGQHTGSHRTISPHEGDQVMAFFFADAIKLGLVRLFKEMNYTPGPNRADREAELAKLNPRIEALDDEYQAMKAEIDALKKAVAE